mgnify:CR=1 FL=1|jgi:hypothetical protein
MSKEKTTNAASQTGIAASNETPEPAANGGGYIVTNLSGVPANYRGVFVKAQTRINNFIRTKKRRVRINGKVVLVGINIDASVRPIDGPGGVLGRAGPTAVASSDRLPVTGIMQFDIADLAEMARRGTLEDVILHEMLHVVGSGTLWAYKGLIVGAGGSNPRFMGRNAIAEYRRISPGNPTSIPVEGDGGQGTRDSHWDERAFGDELLTGFLSGRKRPLSRMSLASLVDMGYQIDLRKADPYRLPSLEEGMMSSILHAPYIMERPDFDVFDAIDNAQDFDDAA